jgi:hypothetical protein
MAPLMFKNKKCKTDFFLIFLFPYLKRMQTHHLYLASKDRDDYNSDPADCRLNISKSLKPKCISLSFAQFPNTYYNITSRNNKIRVAGNIYSITPGTYNLGDLMQALANALVAENIVVSFDDVIGRIIFSSSGFFDLDFTVDDSIYAKVGFKKIYYSDYTSYTGAFVPKIYDTSIFISINGISSGCISPTGRENKNVQNSTFIVPNNVNKGEIIQFYQHSQFNLNPKVDDTINFFDVRFYDDDGFILQNLGEWAMMIELIY